VVLITLFIGSLIQIIQLPPLMEARRGRIAAGGMDFAQSSTSSGMAVGVWNASFREGCFSGWRTLGPDSFRTAETNK